MLPLSINQEQVSGGKRMYCNTAVETALNSPKMKSSCKRACVNTRVVIVKSTELVGISISGLQTRPFIIFVCN